MLYVLKTIKIVIKDVGIEHLKYKFVIILIDALDEIRRYIIIA
ncbi:MAG: hypothetical protein KatS3mg003_2231 [Candidatus Nitrosocaldaceae archaeon]|nr:MAG: hypothetical protein KatS3mg003_2167 [Candidatus Nitrosocaldaceae archaeon]GIU72752.1 MAG: hypothetical protein KatS3mg003_2231 [Candidatus Nitrosocaldaceae archaeon]